MKLQLEITSITRTNIYNYIKDFSLEQVNYIPNNFNNSIGWQVAHIVVTQQLLHYKLSGNEMLVDELLVDSFRKGSSGKYLFTESQWKEVLDLLLSLPKKLEEDYNNNLFKTYSEYATSYNTKLTSIEDAISFSNIHDTLHFGTIMAMKKCLPSS